MSRPQESHLGAALQTLKYLKGSTHQDNLLFKRGYPIEIQGYTDVNWGMCKDTFKSVGAYVFTMARAAISWSSKWQHNVSFSSTEVEYKALSTGAQETTWL